MEHRINIGVSNRHIHLTKETYDLLFDEPITKFKDLTQSGEFATDQKVTLVTENYEISGVRLLGPLRNYNQVEISHNDALKFKIDPPVRKSGDLDGASSIIIRTEKGEVTLNCAIIAQRHIHMNLETANALGVKDNQKVKVLVSGAKGGMMESYIKISDNGVLEMHIDTDDANAFLINNDNNEGILVIDD